MDSCPSWEGLPGVAAPGRGWSVAPAYGAQKGLTMPKGHRSAQRPRVLPESTQHASLATYYRIIGVMVTVNVHGSTSPGQAHGAPVGEDLLPGLMLWFNDYWAARYPVCPASIATTAVKTSTLVGVRADASTPERI